MKTDRELHRDVIDELGCDGRAGGMDIDVTVKNGVVTISGTVGSVAQRVAAERAVKGIEGVKRIIALLAVRDVDASAVPPSHRQIEGDEDHE
jgi:osmotically-inducible protein OsmY